MRISTKKTRIKGGRLLNLMGVGKRRWEEVGGTPKWKEVGETFSIILSQVLEKRFLLLLYFFLRDVEVMIYKFCSEQ